MKNIIKIIIISIFTTSACNDDFLEKYPTDKLSDATFWSSANDVKLYANQFYDYLPFGYWDTWKYYFRFDVRTDIHLDVIRDKWSFGEVVVPGTGSNFTVTGGFGWNKTEWGKIRSCNYALDKIADMTKNDEVLRYEGEIRFFKALLYIYLKLKPFGDVPWLENELNIDSEELFGARDSRKVVVENILEDLNFAIIHLPETDDSDRLTKYAALALKVDLCLFEGTFRKYHELGDYEQLLREAASSAEQIMNSGLFSLYTTGNPNTDYFDLFTQIDLHGNPENIYALYFEKGKKTHNLPGMITANDRGYSKFFVEQYLCIDGLPISLSPLYKGDEIFDDAFINRDPRMYQSILTSDRPLIIYNDGSKLFDPQPNFQKGGSSYIPLKYNHPEEDHRQFITSDVDIFVYRYGQILLEYAEAKAELGECTQAVLDKSINLLRDRVSMPHLTVEVGFIDPNWPDWEVPVTPLINEIRRERVIETAAEGRRWWDLVRWKAGKVLENPNTLLGAYNPATENYYELYPDIKRTWNNRLYLYPIPIEELALNPNLSQNPGWGSN